MSRGKPSRFGVWVPLFRHPGSLGKSLCKYLAA
ncbi:hypothetical protein CGRA01v4_11771 [Colletotrichum graminicola]|nr:hypothetical protein CGRA01v4_11771 [Colletotrichum graminicola]